MNKIIITNINGYDDYVNTCDYYNKLPFTEKEIIKAFNTFKVDPGAFINVCCIIDRGKYCRIIPYDNIKQSPTLKHFKTINIEKLVFNTNRNNQIINLGRNFADL